MNTLGERLKLLRTGNSQQAIAEKFGIPQTTWSNYEKGKNQPDFAFIDKVCLEFRVSADWLLFGRGPREPDNYGHGASVNAEANTVLVDQLETRIATLTNEQAIRRQAELEYRKMTEELIRTQRMLIETQQERINDLKHKS
jgi:transcriptional regulator with XRE-family HTH domain